MKTLEHYHLVRDFLGSQGLQPTVAMLAAPAPEWADLVFLAREWKTARDEAEEARQAELEGLSEEELGQRERDATEEAQREEQRILFHSSGFRPEK